MQEYPLLRVLTVYDHDDTSIKLHRTPFALMCSHEWRYAGCSLVKVRRECNEHSLEVLLKFSDTTSACTLGVG